MNWFDFKREINITEELFAAQLFASNLKYCMKTYRQLIIGYY